MVVAALVIAPDSRGATFKVGTFVKSTAITTQQIPHGLGEVPKAIILWTAGKTNETIGPEYRFAFGLSDGTQSLCLSAASRNGAPGSESNHRLTARALTLVDWAYAIVAEAELLTWNASTFTLNWTENDSSPMLIHYLAIGGTEVSARVLNWQLSRTLGAKVVTGVGFEPELVLSVYGGSSTRNIPANGGGAHLNLAAMSAALDQWTMGMDVAEAGDGGEAYRSQLPGIAIAEADTEVYIDATLSSIDPDGFTLNFSRATGSQGQVLSLALSGLRAKVGSIQKTTATAPALQPVTGVGFQPQAVLLASFLDLPSGVPTLNGRLAFGAADDTSAAASVLQDAYGVQPTQVHGLDKTGKAFVKVDNATPEIDAEADLDSFDPDGFTLRWTTNDAVGTEILYVAMAELPPPPPDAGTGDAGTGDAGTTTDGGTGDAGTTTDGGSGDAGSTTDGGTGDAGTTTDGGGSGDAGSTTDGGTGDAGNDGQDGGGGIPPRTGCGCSAGAGSVFWGALACLLVFGLSRRRAAVELRRRS